MRRRPPARCARGAASWPRLSLLLLLVGCGIQAEPVKTVSSTAPRAPPAGARLARSASLRFLKLISDYSDDDDWQIQSYLRPERRRVRVTAPRLAVLPVLLLDEEAPRREVTYTTRRDQTYDYVDVENTRPVRRDRRPVLVYDEHPSDEYPELQYEQRPSSRPGFTPRVTRDEENNWWSGQRTVSNHDVEVSEDTYSQSQQTQALPICRPVKKEQSGPKYIHPVKPSDVKITVPSLPRSQLMEKYIAQALKTEYHLPAIVQSRFDYSERRILYDSEDDGELEEVQRGSVPREEKTRPVVLPQKAPGRPRFDKALKLRAVLAVPRAGYSEPYTVWWDPKTGDSRIHFQEGSTVTFRKTSPSGRVQRVEMHVDRTDERVVRCAVATTDATPADRMNPALPDIDLFSFSGYDTDGGELVERWEYTTEGPGDVRSETVSTRHELLLVRDAGDSARPIRYRVSANCSICGPDCDGYEHFYSDVRTHNREPNFFEPKIYDVCDEVERLNASSPDDIARLEPLREFTISERDQRYDDFFERYQKQHDRQYDDDLEEAIRKNILRHNLRLISSGNRAGATYRMGINYFSDRLDAEVDLMSGLPPGEPPGAAPSDVPPPDPAAAARIAALPERFDWRAEGAVSDVQYQGNCPACWAFAVAGAVEGALFKRTRRLVPLSVQKLVDCSGPFGGRGCHGTWPSAAYNYVKARGLSALNEYTPYKAQMDKCKENMGPAVTRIRTFVNVSQSVPMMRLAVKENGPVVVLVNRKNFEKYEKGILYNERCSSSGTNHALLVVGWDNQGGEPNFIVKNSWAATWGEGGYARVQARANLCGLLDYGSYPRLERDDVLREDLLK